MAQLGLGKVFNISADASGNNIKLDNAQSVAFVSFLAAGTQTVTLQETIDGASAQNLAIIDEFWKAPGAGGVWSRVAQTAGAVADLAGDATNNMMLVNVRARQLSNGFDGVTATASGGTLYAVVYDLQDIGDPTTVASPF